MENAYDMRLYRVESTIRLYRRIAIGLLIVSGCLVVVAAVRPQDTGSVSKILRTNRLEIMQDGMDRPQIALYGTPQGGWLTVKSADRKAQATIAGGNMDGKFPSHVSISLSSDEGITSIGHARIYGEKEGKHAWCLGEVDGAPYLELYDKTGVKRCQLSLDDIGRMVLASEHGRPLELKAKAN